MHVPQHFRPARPGRAWEVVERHGFGTLVTHDGPDGALATHLPFLARPGLGPRGTLLGHLARANPQARVLEGGAEALAIFAGPSAFVSASWYREEPSVPTWDYVAVHARGRVRPVADDEETLAILRETVAHNEAAAGSPWRLDTSDPWVRGLARGVLAFALEVERLDAIDKLSQNVAPHLRERVVTGLTDAGHEDVAAEVLHAAAVGDGRR